MYRKKKLSVNREEQWGHSPLDINKATTILDSHQQYHECSKKVYADRYP